LDIRRSKGFYENLRENHVKGKRSGGNESKKTYSRIYLRCHLHGLNERLDTHILNRVHPQECPDGAANGSSRC
jgi:hypothetical protein